jgi:hypothetical protein
MSSPGNERRPLLLALVLAAFVVPGSPMLILSGIPFLSPIEVASLILLLIALLWRQTRTELVKLLGNHHTRSLVTLGLIGLIFLKFLLFARFPLQNGFEACYQSTYDTVGVCEKSFNNPFYRNDDINARGDITRVDSTINFGSTSNDPNSISGLSTSNWNLPFTNEYPRFSTLWLDRLPFETDYAGVITVEKRGYIPIEFTGEIDVLLGTQNYKHESYGAKKKLLIPVEAGKQTLRIHYQFRDSPETEIPPTAPKPNGPYASLFVGRVVSSALDLGQQLVVKGWVASANPVNGVEEVALLDDKGKTLESNLTYHRPDVHQVLAMSTQQNTGFALLAPVQSDRGEPEKYFLEATFADGTSKKIAEINWAGFVPLTNEPTVNFITDEVLTTSLDFAAVEIAQQSPTLTAERSNQPSFGWKTLLLLVDALQAIGLISLLVLAFRTARTQIIKGVIQAVLACSAIIIARYIGIRLPGNQVVTEILICIGAFTMGFRNDKKGRWIAIVLSSTFVLVSPALSLLRRFYGIGNDQWWGQLIFRSRDSDWLVYQGYARQIFVNQSLQGGEDIFYFMPGMRYLVYLQHVFFGENDVFIALASSVAMISIVIMLLFASVYEVPKPYIYLVFVAFVLLVIQFCQPIILELSLSTAAEVPAWILFMTAAILAFRPSTTDRQRNVAAALLGLVANFRPNYTFAVIWTIAMLLVVSVISEKDLISRALAVARNALVFTLTASLSLVHNLFYGGSTKPFTNISDPGQKDFEPIELLRFFSDPNIRSLMGKKVLTALRWNNGGAVSLEMMAAIGIQFIWLLIFFVVVRRGRNIVLCLCSLVTPLALLLSYMPFRFTDTPQRHFLMLSITFVLSATSAVMLSNAPSNKPHTLSPT